MKIEPNNIYQGDCLDLMKYIPDKSIDMILCDLPYGTTACKWDTAIPFNRHIKEINNRGKEIILYRDEYILQEVKKGKSYNEIANYFDNNAIDGLWDNYKRIIKDNGAIVLFGSESFSSKLRLSNIRNYKYDWIWNKIKPVGHLVAKYRPMQKTENISIFCLGKCNYYPIMEKREKPVKGKEGKRTEIMGGKSNQYAKTYYEKYPQSILTFSKTNRKEKLHSTQKPVSLCEYLIKTYTNESETVLDNCMGSGSTCVACINTNRQYIGIEKELKYFEIAKKRIDGVTAVQTELKGGIHGTT